VAPRWEPHRRYRYRWEPRRRHCLIDCEKDKRPEYERQTTNNPDKRKTEYRWLKKESWICKFHKMQICWFLCISIRHQKKKRILKESIFHSSAKNTNYLAENKILAPILYNYFHQIHFVSDITQPTKGVYVIDASHCPSVLVECGSNVSKRPCFCKRRKWPGANREKYITVYWAIFFCKRKCQGGSREREPFLIPRNL